MDFARLAETYGTPLYVYDAQRLQQKARAIRSLDYAPFDVHFASMCNDTPGILDFFRRQGIKLFVNSLRHLYLGLDLGFPADDIIFTGTNLTENDFAAIAETGVTLNVDSLGQLEAFCLRNPGKAVGLRLNFDYTVPGNRAGVFIGHNSRIGIFASDFPEARRIAGRSDVRINGVHAYLGTDISNLETFVRGTAEVLRLAREFPDLEYVDLGGGFGVPAHPGEPEFPIAEYKARIAQMMKSFVAELGRPVKLVLEPGRWLAADSGYMLTRVVDVKRRADRTYIGTDASVAIFPRPLFYADAYHEVTVWNKDGQAPDPLPADICGSTTYSRDYLAQNRQLPRVECGDLLVFENAGGYCVSAMTNFLGRLRPAEVLVDGDEAVLVRPAEVAQRSEALAR